MALFVSKCIYFMICIAAGRDHGSDSVHLFIFSDNSASGTAQFPKAYHSAEANHGDWKKPFHQRDWRSKVCGNSIFTALFLGWQQSTFFPLP